MFLMGSRRLEFLSELRINVCCSSLLEFIAFAYIKSDNAVSNPFRPCYFQATLSLICLYCAVPGRLWPTRLHHSDAGDWGL
jgi:hypothetical protein